MCDKQHYTLHVQSPVMLQSSCPGIECYFPDVGKHALVLTPTMYYQLINIHLKS